MLICITESFAQKHISAFALSKKQESSHYRYSFKKILAKFQFFAISIVQITYIKKEKIKDFFNLIKTFQTFAAVLPSLLTTIPVSPCLSRKQWLEVHTLCQRTFPSTLWLVSLFICCLLHEP